MRPGQQNSNNNNNKNRSRGRGSSNNNGGRKHLNPLSRNYESNGPDVKVRGNAAHIAEKYVQLARDAHASGDSVMAENYFQHAEHYFRIVSAAQPQGMPRLDQFGQEIDGDEDDGDEGTGSTDGLEQHARIPDEPVYRNDRQPRDERPVRDERPMREDRPVREDRPREDRPQRQPRIERPAFVEAITEAEAVNQAAAAPVEQAEAQAPVEAVEGEVRRPRRPRRPRRVATEGGEDPAAAPQPDVGELPAFITAGNPTTAD